MPFQPAVSPLDVEFHVVVGDKTYHCVVTCPRSVWR